MMDTTKCTHCGQQFDATEAGCPACGHLQTPAPCAKHPDREAHGQCVICGTAVCSECDGGSGHHACQLHREIPIFEGWAQIYSTGDDVEAELIRENLRSEGIDSEVLSQRDQTFRVELGDLSPVRVLVPAFDYAAGLEVLSDRMDSAGEVAFACASCGEAYDPGQTVCASCQADLSAR